MLLCHKAAMPGIWCTLRATVFLLRFCAISVTSQSHISASKYSSRPDLSFASYLQGFVTGPCQGQVRGSLEDLHVWSACRLCTPTCDSSTVCLCASLGPHGKVKLTGKGVA